MANILDYLNSKLQDPNKQEIGIGGFTLFARVKDSYKLNTNVPTTPVEDGSFVNDHIILQPLIITISGDVSDIHLKRSEIARELTTFNAEVGNLVGQFGSSATQAQLQQLAQLENTFLDAVNAIDAVLAAGTQALNYFGNKDPDTKTIQEQFIDAMDSFYYARQPIKIDMPFRQLDNMVITSFTSETDNSINSTTFTINAQQILYTGLSYTAVEAKPASGTNGQLDSASNKGTQSGTPVESSLWSELLG